MTSIRNPPIEGTAAETATLPWDRRRAVAVPVAVAAWTGVLLQLYSFIDRALTRSTPMWDAILAFLGYFSILTNIAVGAALTAIAVAPGSAAGRRAASPQSIGALTAAIVLVALGYHLLLRGLWTPQGLDKVSDVLLHTVTPVLVLLYWWLVASGRRLSWRDPLQWALYPVAYFAYVLVRGVLIGAYPYPFIDVATIGYAQSLLSAVGLLIAFLAVGWMLVAVTRWRAD